MSRFLIPNAKQVFLDNNGEPLAGGFVFFYVPGSTDFKDTFPDPGTDVANSNPVVLDAAGRATIWGEGIYRQIVLDSLGNLIWDSDTSVAGEAEDQVGAPIDAHYILGLANNQLPNMRVVTNAYGMFWDLGTPAQAKVRLTECLQFACSDQVTPVTVGGAALTSRMPYGFTLTNIRASLKVAQVSGSTFTVDLNVNGVSVLSTKLTIDNTERTSRTAAIAPVISDNDIPDDAELIIDVDQVGNGTAVGLIVTLIGYQQDVPAVPDVGGGPEPPTYAFVGPIVTGNFVPVSPTVFQGIADNSLVDSDETALKWPKTEGGQWIKFDFTTAREIVEVTWVQSAVNNQGTFVIEGSNDNTRWQRVKEDFTLGGGYTQVIPIVAPGSWRYWRFRQLSGLTNQLVRLIEAQFLSRPLTPTVPVTTTPSYDNLGGRGIRLGVVAVTTNFPTFAGLVQNLVDGVFVPNVDHAWMADNQQTSKHIQFDFGTAKKISAFTFYQLSNINHRRFCLQGSSDGSSFVQLGTEFVLNGIETEYTGFPTGTAYRYYRIAQFSADQTPLQFSFFLEFEFKISD